MCTMPPKSSATWISWARAVLVLSLLGGCASDPTSHADTRLSGAWRLDSGASDDLTARVDKAITAAEERYQKARRGGYGDSQGFPVMGNGRGGGRGGGAGGGAGSADNSGTDAYALEPRIGPDFTGLRAKLLENLAAPRSLRIDAVADLVRLTGDDVPARDYHPGDAFTRFDEYGTAKMRSKWTDAGFTITAHYTNHASRTDTYALDPHADTLRYTRSVVDPTIGKLEVQSLYRRE